MRGRQCRSLIILFLYGHSLERAINEHISNGVPDDFLKENRAEVLKMGLYEYNEEEHIRMEREAAKEEGRAEGRSEGVLYNLTFIIRKNI